MDTKLTLRDHFAIAAMQVLLTNKTGYIVGDDVASNAYSMAGHMIRERNKHIKERHEELCNVSNSG